MHIEQFALNLTADDLLLTANRRLAHYLQGQFNLSQTEKGLAAWESLSVLSLHTWAEKIWVDYPGDKSNLLSDFQERLLWEKIISEAMPEAGWVEPSTMADLAQTTWKLLQNWQLNLDEIKNAHALDVQTFIHWAELFKKTCQDLNLISRSEILAAINSKINTEGIFFALPKNIYFIGFDDFSPNIKILQHHLKKGANLKIINFENEYPATITKIGLNDNEQELQAMARWSYQQLIKNKNATIGCIVPNLTTLRDKVIRIFEETHLSAGIGNEYPAPLFNISVAQKLGKYPVIRTALIILSLHFSRTEFSQFSDLLRSPFIIAAQEELAARTILDVQLREQGQSTISIKKLLKFFNPCKILKLHLEKFITLCDPSNKKIKLEAWVIIFVKQLSILGWPGDRSLTSIEFQTVERFKKILDEYIAINSQDEFYFKEAYNLLYKLIHSTLFQEKSENMPIQILGVLEATGINFDYVWMAGLDNENWPPSASPNPFIPIAIQKKYQMPHASAERELKFSQGVMQRLIKNSKEIIFSYSQFDKDRPLLPSALITSFSDQLNLENISCITHQIYQTKSIEYFVDDKAPEIFTEFVAGGSSIVKSQSACPFQAFAKFRLHAKPLEEIKLGLDAKERGILIHEILAIIWSQIKTHAMLCALTAESLDLLINEAIDQTFKKSHTDKLGYLSLEKIRLMKIITTWLTLEKSRPPFEVVALEQASIKKIGPLSIKIQMDRIDKLQDDRHIIIDYKTGKSKIQHWFSDRPQEPQMPLYALLSEKTITGLLFAQLRADELGFQGLTDLPQAISGVLTFDQLKIGDLENWQALMSYWKTILYQLANDFYQGDARVNPRGQDACQYCHFESLCRKNSLGFLKE